MDVQCSVTVETVTLALPPPPLVGSVCVWKCVSFYACSRDDTWMIIRVTLDLSVCV